MKRLLVVAGCMLCGQAAQAGMENAELRAELLFGYGTAAGVPMQAAIELEPAADLAFRAGSRLVVAGRIRADTRDRLVPGRPDTSTYAGASRPRALGDHAVAELRDAYLELPFRRGLVRMGKQQVVWGAMDGFRILDALNPHDFREFILEDAADSRIGLWSVYADASLGAWRAELALVPEVTGHAIPERGAWFELTAPRFRYGAPPSAENPAMRTNRPPSGLRHAAGGIRLSRMLGNWDVAAVAISGYDFEPLGRIDDTGAAPLLERYYERRRIFGLSGAGSFGRIALRTELAWLPGRTFNLRDEAALGAAALDQYTAAVGLDVDGPLDTFINVQYVIDRVRSAPAALVRPATDRLATLFLRRSFAYDTVTAELRWYVDTQKRDSILRGRLAWNLGDETTMTLGFDAFAGRADGLFGQFAERDRVTLSLERYF